MSRKCLWKIAGLMEDLFLGSQWSIILGYRRLSVKFLFTSHFYFLFISWSFMIILFLNFHILVPNCQVFILENCWTGQNILGHDYKRKRGELRSTDLWIPHLLNAGDLSFGISIIWKLHQIHFVFFFIVLGY